MAFDPLAYGPEVAAILALDGNGQRLMPLAEGTCSSEEARTRLRSATATGLFPNSRAPLAALSGLWLYFSCYDESHNLSQDIPTSDGSFWHGILHRQEPDAGNASYWFRQVGEHPVFEPLMAEAQALAADEGIKLPWSNKWDPFAFIDFCERARRKPGSEDEQLAQRIQRAEWQLLFDHCARSHA
ncbi:MAG TPA: hypothetical protein VE621_08460 [Bryobacteraceae bacterium]|jgi:hypothetical protein|nr:hypothetical protein [Bryobacteraceae bacterium]